MCLVGSHLYVNVVICHRNTFTQACHYSSTQPNVTSEPTPGSVGKQGAGYHLSTVPVIHPDQRCAFVCTPGIEFFVLVNEMDLFSDVMIGCWSEPMGHYLSLSDVVELCVRRRSTPLLHSNNLHCFKKGENHYFSHSRFPLLPLSQGSGVLACVESVAIHPLRWECSFLCVCEELASTLQCFLLLIQTFYTLQKDVERLFRALWELPELYLFGADELSQVMVGSCGQSIPEGFKTKF